MRNKKIAAIKGALFDCLEKADSTHLERYFCDDVKMMLNEKTLTGINQLRQRLNWIKSNMNSVKITLEKILISGDCASELHYSDVIDDQANHHKIKVMSMIEFRDNKICHFEAIDVDLNAPTLKVATSTE